MRGGQRHRRPGRPRRHRARAPVRDRPGGRRPGAAGTAQGRPGHRGARRDPRPRPPHPRLDPGHRPPGGRGHRTRPGRQPLPGGAVPAHGTGWEAGPVWPARNALRGWTDDHWAGDLRSPIGVYTLTDAGGLLPDPGTRLPYDRSDGFAVSGTGFEGEPLEGSFDYVVAIDYNREPGTSPLDLTRPLGADRGGGIWLHVDHDGPTQGCVSLSEQHMRDLLLALDPALHPVVVMGDAASLRE